MSYPGETASPVSGVIDVPLDNKQYEVSAPPSGGATIFWKVADPIALALFTVGVILSWVYIPSIQTVCCGLANLALLGLVVALTFKALPFFTSQLPAANHTVGRGVIFVYMGCFACLGNGGLALGMGLPVVLYGLFYVLTKYINVPALVWAPA
ncbi:hypothetical protein DFJ74DRAFT_697096 [Hyaloraphidium curvatum]|nr:hypothetical protein DFJ74DRAFT_697096 [Hyaloraphidium curvatum]